MLGLPHAECLTLTIGAFLAVRSIVLASQAEQKTISLQPELSEVVHECLSTEAELAQRLLAAITKVVRSFAAVTSKISTRRALSLQYAEHFTGMAFSRPKAVKYFTQFTHKQNHAHKSSALQGAIHLDHACA